MAKWPSLRRDITAAALLLLVLIIVWWIGGYWFYRRFIAAAYIGALVGMGEIVARYRDAPERALRTTSAVLYILINATASIVAMYVVWTFGLAVAATGGRTTVQQIFLAGFGAMALFRTSLFTMRVGDQDVGIGPVVFLQVILRATDRAVDRIRADARAAAVTTSMAGVSFERAQTALPMFCLALMQNVPADEQKAVGDAVNALRAATLDNDTKARNLGLALMNVVGEKVLATAVTTLAQQIQKTDRINLLGLPATLSAGDTLEITAECLDRNKTVLTGRRVAWSPDNSAIATVAGSGHVVAVAKGTTLIRAVSDDVEGRALVTVTAATV